MNDPTPAQRLAEQHKKDSGMVGELLKLGGRLTKWERDFADSLSRWLELHDELTRRQRSTARRIHQRWDDHWQEMEEIPWHI